MAFSPAKSYSIDNRLLESRVMVDRSFCLVSIIQCCLDKESFSSSSSFAVIQSIGIAYISQSLSFIDMITETKSLRAVYVCHDERTRFYQSCASCPSRFILLE